MGSLEGGAISDLELCWLVGLDCGGLGGFSFKADRGGAPPALEASPLPVLASPLGWGRRSRILGVEGGGMGGSGAGCSGGPLPVLVLARRRFWGAFCCLVFDGIAINNEIKR